MRALNVYDPADLGIAFEESGQSAIGRHLFQETLGRLPSRERPRGWTSGVDLRIRSEDTFALALPWVLLADGARFLVNSGWSVSFETQRKLALGRLPPSPRMLILAPTPAHLPDTEADAHLTELDAVLRECDPLLQIGENIAVTHDWASFVGAATAQHWDLFYYYGHATGDGSKTRLLIDGKGERFAETPVANLADALANMPGGPPALAYVNCCQGDAGGHLGVGSTLGQVVCAVLTNRTIAEIEVARRQALELWRMLILEGAPPHDAVSRLRSNLAGQGLSFRYVRWMNLVLHRGYLDWVATPYAAAADEPFPQGWRMRVDRDEESHLILSELGISEDCDDRQHRENPCALSYLWYSEKDNGLTHFADRLLDDIRTALVPAPVVQLRPSYWPQLHGSGTDSLAKPRPSRVLEDMLLGAAGVQSLGAIGAKLRIDGGIQDEQELILVVLHQFEYLVTPGELGAYALWWNTRVDVLQRQNLRPVVLLSVPVRESEDGIALEKGLRLGAPEEKRGKLSWLTGWLRPRSAEDGLKRAHLKNLHLTSIGYLPPLTEDQLKEFLERHGLFERPDVAGKALRDVLSETRGRYDPTVEALVHFEDRVLDATISQGY
jgi:hypothetical protein